MTAKKKQDGMTKGNRGNAVLWQEKEIRGFLGIFRRKMRDDFLWDIFLPKKRGVTVIG